MKILICVPVYNRKQITELCLRNLVKYKDDATLWIYNDCSTDYDNVFLEQYADKVYQLATYNLGIDYLRWYQFRQFSSQVEFDYLYFTDSDALHDPSFLHVLKSLVKRYDYPISLYTSSVCPIESSSHVFFRKNAGGISHFYSKPMVNKIVFELNKEQRDPCCGWDYKAIEYLGKPILSTHYSLLEHFGADGLHSGLGDFEHDRARYPTQYLKLIRKPVIDYLSNIESSFTI